MIEIDSRSCTTNTYPEFVIFQAQDLASHINKVLVLRVWVLAEDT